MRDASKRFYGTCRSELSYTTDRQSLNQLFLHILTFSVKCFNGPQCSHHVTEIQILIQHDSLRFFHIVCHTPTPTPFPLEDFDISKNKSLHLRNDKKQTFFFPLRYSRRDRKRIRSRLPNQHHRAT